MKSAKGIENFPYRLNTTCMFQVFIDGSVKQIDRSSDDMFSVLESARDGKSKLYAVWPGKYSSDLFLLDDLDAFADAFGLAKGREHIHEISWVLDDDDDGRSPYALVEMRLLCGCELNSRSLRSFADQMRKTRGWDIAVSGGLPCHYDNTGATYLLRVRRNTLR